MSESPAEQNPATAELLARYVRDGDPAAFGSLTRRYHPLVLAAALRRCEGRQSLAEDAAQQVFIDLARRASGLRADERLGGWLHRRAIRAAGDIMKSETRRRRREAVAAVQLQSETAEPRWADAAPLIDAALQRLSARDRDAVLLRCVEGRDFRDVGTALGLSDDAAQKCVSRALEKLRSLLRRRGVVPTLTAITAGLAADHARAAGFSGAAAHTAAQALQSAGTASTAAAPWLLHAKAAAAGAALACAAWAWPLSRAVGNDDAAPVSAANSNSQDSTPAGLRRLHFPALPKMDQGLSVDEILARIAALAPLPQSASTRKRFEFFADQLGAARIGEALQKMRVTFPAGLLADVDRHGWRVPLIRNWGWNQPAPAMDYAWSCLPQDVADPLFEEFLDAILTIAANIPDGESGAWEKRAVWMNARLHELCEQPRGPRQRRLLEFFQHALAHSAVSSKSREVLESVVSLVNEYRLTLLDNAGNMTSDVETLELLLSMAPLLEPPARRAAFTGNAIQKLGDITFPGARQWVEQVEDPAQRLIWARKVGVPPIYSRGTNSGNMELVPQEHYKERADWLLGLAEDGKRTAVIGEIGRAWLVLDPAWGLQWMSDKLPAATFARWLEKRSSGQALAIAAGTTPRATPLHLTLMLHHLRKADPQGAAAFIEKLRTENQRRSHAAELNELLDAP